MTRRGYLLAASFALALASVALAFSIASYRQVRTACYPTIAPPGGAIATERSTHT